MRLGKFESFTVITVIYIIAAGLGVALYVLLPFDLWLDLLLADVICTVFVFIFSVIFKNASVYDPYWSVQPIAILVAFSIGAKATPLRALILIAVLLWGIRLTANWAYTFGDLSHQDWRYTMLKEKTGSLYPIVNFVGIHLVPTLVVYACTMPAVVAFTAPSDFTWWSLPFIIISLGAVALQATADVQMHSFRKKKKAGKISAPFIRNGVWKHSRHPNYLAEILMWWGIGLSVVVAMPEMWYLLLGALANTCLFLFVSIPLADGRQSQKKGFDKYKAETRMLLPVKKFKR